MPRVIGNIELFAVVAWCYLLMWRELVRKAGTKSVVWGYFGLKEGSNGVIFNNGTAICWSCQNKVAAKHRNTSNLLAHLRIHHGELPSEVTALMKSDKRGKETNESCLAQAINASSSY